MMLRVDPIPKTRNLHESLVYLVSIQEKDDAGDGRGKQNSVWARVRALGP